MINAEKKSWKRQIKWIINTKNVKARRSYNPNKENKNAKRKQSKSDMDEKLIKKDKPDYKETKCEEQWDYSSRKCWHPPQVDNRENKARNWDKELEKFRLGWVLQNVQRRIRDDPSYLYMHEDQRIPG